ncbi:MAG: hypothetical protein HQ562_03655 [Candidatus Marinimicrobia bacterium]|nr:hypothetical protein [Candidatus Neomarinimicrobiota bacterium]
MKFQTNLLFILLMSFVASGISQDVSIHGYARTYLGVLTNEPYDYSISQNTLDLKLEGSVGKGGFYANPYLYQYPNQVIDIGLREVYLDIFFDKLDLRLGKQQIIWGKGDGVFITDIVSPKDLSEFLLRDFDEIRMGVTSAKIDYYLGNNTLELVWIPTFTPTTMPDSTSLWARLPAFDIPIAIDESEKTISGRLENSEGFIKFSGMSSLIDFELMAGIMWDDDPTLHITPIMELGNPQPASLLLMPKHHQLTLGGGSFSTELGRFVIRGEGAYYKGKSFAAENTLGMPLDLMEKDFIHYLVGTDFSIGSNLLSFQFIQRTIMDFDDSIVSDEFDNTMTFLFNRTFLSETLAFQFFGYLGLNNEDALLRPTLTYDIADGFEIITGANLFVRNDDTKTDGLFGYYDDNDMVFVKVKYSF